MSNQPTDPQAAGESTDDLDVPAEEAESVTGGFTLNASEDDAPGDSPQGSIQSI